MGCGLERAHRRHLRYPMGRGLQVHAHTGQIFYYYGFFFFFPFGGLAKEQKMEENELRSSQGQPITTYLPFFYSVFTFFAAFFFFFFLLLHFYFYFLSLVLRTYPLYMLLIMCLLASTVLEGRICVCTLFISYFTSHTRTGKDPDAGHWYITRWLGKAIQQSVSQLLTHVFLYAPDDHVSFVSRKRNHDLITKRGYLQLTDLHFLSFNPR